MNGHNPPVEMVVDVGHQTLAITVLCVVVGASLIWALAALVRRRDALMLALLVGGLMCAVNEPVVDVLGNVWFAGIGQISVYQWSGRSLPLWGALAYVLYFGLMPYLLLRCVERGMTRAAFWKIMGVAFALNLAIEIPMLGLNLYTYYGYSPMQVGGLPLYWLLINVGGPLLTVTLLYHFRDAFRGLRLLLLLLVPATADAAMSLAVGWPAFAGLHQADGQHAVTWIGCAGSLLLGAFVIDQLGRVLTRPPLHHRAAPPALSAPAMTTR